MCWELTAVWARYSEGNRRRASSVSSTPVLVNPNAGLPRSENGKTVYDIDAVRFGEVMEEIVKMGAVIVEGAVEPGRSISGKR